MPATALVTSEQYLALPDQFDQNGNRIKDELIGGEIVQMLKGVWLNYTGGVFFLGAQDARRRARSTSAGKASSRNNREG